MKSSAEFECECTVRTIFDFTLPEYFNPTNQSVKCRGCHAIWIVRFRKTTDGNTFTFKLSIPSVKLGEYLKKKRDEARKNLPQKKAPQFFMK